MIYRSPSPSTLFLLLLGTITVSLVVWVTSQPSILYAQTPLPTAPPLLQRASARVSNGALVDEAAISTTLPAMASELAIAPSLPLVVDTSTLARQDSFLGFGFDDNPTENNGSYAIPPDSMGAVGNDQVLAVVNTMIEARSKSGNLLWRDSLKDFFATLGGSTLATRGFDPKVIYDHYANRFVVVTLERNDTSRGDATNGSRLLLAVSKNASPATATSADWYYHAINTKLNIGGVDHWADFPGLEADEEAIYITANLYTFGTPRTPGGVRLWIVDKGLSSGFYAGSGASVTVQDPFQGGALFGTAAPAEVYGPGGAGSSVGTYLVIYDGLTDGTDEFITVIRVDNPLNNPTFTSEQVNVGNLENLGGSFGFPPLPAAPQNGTATKLDTGDRRILDAVWHAGKLWLVATINPRSGANTNQTTAHWWQLDTTTPSITLVDQGDIGADDLATTTYTFFPSLAVNANQEVCFGFSASAATLFPGAYYTGRGSTDPASSLQASQSVETGKSYYVRTFGSTRNRWGDYSSTVLDPADPAICWLFNAFAESRGSVTNNEDGRWGTAWGSFRHSAVVTPVVTPTPMATVPTPTATLTPIPTPSATSTPLFTATATQSPTPTPTTSIVSTPTATATLLGTTVSPTLTPIATATFTMTVAPTPMTILISSNLNGVVPGLGDYRDEDILAWHAADNSWTWFFDGGDVGLSASDVDAFALLPNSHLLISLEANFNLAGLGPVDDADVLEFTPTVLGANTAGSWSFYLHGTEVGLETAGEDIDSLALDKAGKLLIGVKGAFNALGTSGFDEDILRFATNSLGAITAGSIHTSNWVRTFEGSLFSLTTANEDRQDGWVDPATGDEHFTTLGGFRINRRDGTAILQGDSNDVIHCQQVNTNQGADCLFTNFWDGGAHGMGANAIDGLHIGDVPGLVTMTTNVHNSMAEPPNDDTDEPNPLDGSEVPDELLPPAAWDLYLPMISK